MLIVERHVMMQYGGQASRYVYRLVERRGIGPRLCYAEREETGRRDREYDKRKPVQPSPRHSAHGALKPIYRIGKLVNSLLVSLG